MIGIHPDTLAFLSELEANNERKWFEANKARYVETRKQFISFIGALYEKVSKIEKLPAQDPAKNVFRIYRDIRFSKNKEPYKLNFGGWIDRGTGPQKSVFYIQIQPGASFAGGGFYQPAPAELKAIRREIHYKGEKFRAIVNSSLFKREFGGLYNEGMLKKAPQGFEPDHPYIEYLRYKHYVISKNLPDKLVLSKQFPEVCVEIYKNGLEFFHFLDEANLNAE